jgi:hypothetical protein
MLRVHVDDAAGAELSSTLDELVAEGARRMLTAALVTITDSSPDSITEITQALIGVVGLFGV